MPRVRPIAVLDFGASAIVNEAVRHAAVARVAEAVARGDAPIVVCSPRRTEPLPTCNGRSPET